MPNRSLGPEGPSVVALGWPVVAVVAGRMVMVGTARVGFGVANAAGGTPALAASGVVPSGGRGAGSRSQAVIEAATSTAIRIGARATTVRTRLPRIRLFAGWMAGTQLLADRPDLAEHAAAVGQDLDVGIAGRGQALGLVEAGQDQRQRGHRRAPGDVHDRRAPGRGDRRRAAHAGEESGLGRGRVRLGA